MTATLNRQPKAPELSGDAQFALDYVASMDPQAAEADTADVLAMVESLKNVDEGLLVLGRLSDLAKDNRRVKEALERGEDLKYGNGLIEVTSLDELPKATSRFLKGKNTGVVVRAGVWGERVGDVGDAVVDLLAPVGQLNKVGVEKFPKKSMPAGSSRLHLDNFIYGDAPHGFRYTLSAAQVETGKALFISGVASRRGGARDITPKTEGQIHPYEQAVIRLEEDPKVKFLYESAQRGRPKGHSEFDAKEGTHVSAVVLNPGDTVLWAQGGPGSDAADWHAFRQVGDEKRTSTSYHYVMQIPEAA